MKLNQLDPHLAPEPKLENPDIRWKTGIRDGELLNKGTGSELPKKISLSIPQNQRCIL